MDIYVGNLPYTATEEDVTDLFAAYGPVERVKIITDRETGRSKGFAFVTLGDQSQLNAAIEALDGQDYQGRALRVNASEPKEARPGGGGGGYGGERRGGGGGGGGYKGGGGGGGGYKGGGGGGGYKGGGGGGDRRGGGGGGYKGGGGGRSNDDWG
jgi:RNA recognition motif-containing protein